MTSITLVVHGGAGTIRKGNMTPRQETAYHAALKQALDAGFEVLASGGNSIVAVISAITILEDSPLFNAGKGAVFTHDGKNELDASLMDGSNLKAGAVVGVTTIKNPIKAAHAVMTKSEHVMLAGRGADAFAKEHGLEIVDPAYFVDSVRYQQFLDRRKAQKAQGGAFGDIPGHEKKFGTVGAVAIDQFGNIAAGTSTGGMSDKRFVIMKKLARLGGNGGIIALDRSGNISMTFNTEGMYRGYIRSKGEAKTFLYGEERE